MPKKGFSIGCHKCGNIAVLTETNRTYLHDKPILVHPKKHLTELVCTSDRCGNRMAVTANEQEEDKCASSNENDQP